MDYTYQPSHGEDNTNIASVWVSMDQSKGDLIDRSKEYGRLTVPSICPEDNEGNIEASRANVMIGPRLINFLAHKVVNVIFPNDRPFFKIELDPEVEFELGKTVDQQIIDSQKTTILVAGLRVTKVAMKKLNMLAYRPVAIEAVKHLIVTGNAVVRRLPSGKRVVYGVKDFGVFRTLDGEAYDIIVKDHSRFDALDRSVQDRVRAVKIGVQPYNVVCLYSRWRKQGNKWEFTQAVDDVPLGTFTMLSQKDFPLIMLTWTLARGENYGRGLVEDNIAAFNGIDVSTTALLDLFGIAADIKFLVDPGSVIDIEELIASVRGSYHQGREGDITSPEVGRQKMADLQVLAESISNWERALSAAFLMASGSIRDAERVTAEEIRFYAREIEAAFGGLYSQLSQVWQKTEADWAISQVDAQIPKVMQTVVTTGVDALSQDAALENLRMSLADLGLLNSVPEDYRGELSMTRIAEFIFASRNLPVNQFTLTPEEKKEKADALMAQQQQMQAMQTQGAVTEAAAKGAVAQQ